MNTAEDLTKISSNFQAGENDISGRKTKLGSSASEFELRNDEEAVMCTRVVRLFSY
jgi:hypothetical protein